MCISATLNSRNLMLSYGSLRTALILVLYFWRQPHVTTCTLGQHCQVRMGLCRLSKQQDLVWTKAGADLEVKICLKDIYALGSAQSLCLHE